MSDASIPGVPFDPRRVGPLDLAIAAVRKTHQWMIDHSTGLIAAIAGLIGLQAFVAAQYGFWFVRVPTLPNWFLVMILTFVFFTPFASVAGVLLGRGLYNDETVLISVQSANEGDQRIKHVSPDRFDTMTIMSQNGDVRGSSYLQQVSINGRRAYEVDTFDEERDVLVASDMAGRTNQQIRSDRIAIRKIKTDMEAQVDEAVEMKANARDIIRERAAKVSNWIIRTAQGATIPDGAELFDDMEDSLDDVEPLADMDRAKLDEERDDGDDGDRGARVDAGDGEDEPGVRVDIFDRAEAAATDGGTGEEAPKDE